MESQKFDRNDHDDSDKYSSSENSSNIGKSIKVNNRKGKEKAISSRAKPNTRENYIQKKFNELSSMIPGSNKDDEDSLLGDTINYLRSLEERINILEEQKKNILFSKAWAPFGDKKIGESSFLREALPEIEANAKGKNVAIRVYCENRKGYLTKVLGEIEKLHLSVENISSITVEDYFLDIAVTTQMSHEFSMTMKDLKKELREALQ